MNMQDKLQVDVATEAVMELVSEYANQHGEAFRAAGRQATKREREHLKAAKKAKAELRKGLQERLHMMLERKPSTGYSYRETKRAQDQERGAGFTVKLDRESGARDCDSVELFDANGNRYVVLRDASDGWFTLRKAGVRAMNDQLHIRPGGGINVVEFV